MMSAMQFQGIEARASRREALKQMGAGFGWLALTSLLAEEAAASGPLALREPHFAPRAKRVIMLFMFGGPSHIDTFDPKPLLNRDSGKPLPFAKPRIISFPRRAGDLIGSPFEFKQYGQSGAYVSELFPHVAGIVDDLAIVRSMHCTNPPTRRCRARMAHRERYVHPTGHGVMADVRPWFREPEPARLHHHMPSLGRGRREQFRLRLLCRQPTKARR